MSSQQQALCPNNFTLQYILASQTERLRLLVWLLAIGQRPQVQTQENSEAVQGSYSIKVHPRSGF